MEYQETQRPIYYRDREASAKRIDRFGKLSPSAGGDTLAGFANRFIICRPLHGAWGSLELDVKFISDLINKLEADYRIAPEPIYEQIHRLKPATTSGN